MGIEEIYTDYKYINSGLKYSRIIFEKEKQEIELCFKPKENPQETEIKIVNKKIAYWEGESGNICRSFDGENYEENMGMSWEGMGEIDDDKLKQAIKKAREEK